jgi:dethiobiotin synthetase
MIAWKKSRMGKIIFVTGTDTGVGKTLFTGLLLHHLRSTGHHALAMKPFCSGGTSDVEFLSGIQNGELSREEMNPFYFSEPIAPLVAARKLRRKISLTDVTRKIESVAKRCEVLLIEGSGGLLVPLGEKFLVRDLIAKLNCEVIVVSRNRLGTINHTLLTVGALQKLRGRKIKVVLMNGSEMDFSSATNGNVLKQLIYPFQLFSIGFLGENTSLKNKHKKVKKTLARVLN